MPLSGLGDDSLEGLTAAFSGLSVRGREGKEKEKENPSRTHLWRACRAPLISLQYPLQQPLNSQPHIQLHPHPQPLHLRLRV